MNTSSDRREPPALSNKERVRIGRALHEGVAQELAAAAFMLASLATHLPTGGELARLELGRIREILERNIRALHDLAHAIAAESVEAAPMLTLPTLNP